MENPFDLKHNTPLTTEEAREIDKAFLRMDKLKLKRFDDSLDSVKKKPASQRAKWLTKQSKRAGKVEEQAYEIKRQKDMRKRHLAQISEQNARTVSATRANTTQPTIKHAFAATTGAQNPKATAGHRPTRTNKSNDDPASGGGAEAPSNPRLVGRSSGGKRKKSPTKTDSESSDSDTGEALVVALEVPPLREKRNLKRQRLQDTPTDRKRDLETLEERQWISSKKKFIRKVRRFAGTAASTWMKKRSRRTATAAASPNRDRAKKYRSYMPVQSTAGGSPE